MSSVIVPETTRKQLMSSFTLGQRVSAWPNYFYVTDKANAWLTQHLGITTCGNEAQINGGAFTVRFHWRVEQWAACAQQENRIYLFYIVDIIFCLLYNLFNF